MVTHVQRAWARPYRGSEQSEGWMHDPCARLIYQNPLASASDVCGFHLEGEAIIAFPNGRLRLENNRSPADGQRANFVLWCPEEFPQDVAISWDFWPVREPGLCMLFFSASGRNGHDLFDQQLARRTGEYAQYHHGDIDAFHLSYYRRNTSADRAFHTCNLRKSYGFHLVCRGADPLPAVAEARPPYHLMVVKRGLDIRFVINDLVILEWRDDGRRYGLELGGGKIGFRQMAPLIGEYANLQVRACAREGNDGE